MQSTSSLELGNQWRGTFVGVPCWRRVPRKGKITPNWNYWEFHSREFWLIVAYVQIEWSLMALRCSLYILARISVCTPERTVSHIFEGPGQCTTHLVVLAVTQLVSPLGAQLGGVTEKNRYITQQLSPQRGKEQGIDCQQCTQAKYIKNKSCLQEGNDPVSLFGHIFSSISLSDPRLVVRYLLLSSSVACSYSTGADILCKAQILRNSETNGGAHLSVFLAGEKFQGRAKLLQIGNTGISAWGSFG